MSGFVKDTFVKRVSGDRPSPVKASIAAMAAGAAVAVIAYRVLRS
jgi:hypothetical protein